MIRLLVLLCLAVICSSNIRVEAADSDEIFDTYFFLTNDDSLLGASDQARITGQAGSVVEVKGDAYRVDRGVVTVTAKSKPLNVVMDVVSMTVPANSSVTVKLDQSTAAITANQIANNGTITINTTTGQSATLSSGQSLPPDTSPLAQCVAKGSSRPMLVIGHNIACELTERDQTLSLTHGRMLFCPPRDIKIETSMGLVTAPAQSQFYLMSTNGFLRILCCRGHSLKFNYKSKYRRIGVAEEFSIWDHRPMELEVVPPDGIGRKDVTMIDLDGKEITASKALFSVVSLLKSQTYLGDWKRRSDIDRKLEDGMLRTAAAFAAANPSAGTFQQTPPMFTRSGEQGMR